MHAIGRMLTVCCVVALVSLPAPAESASKESGAAGFNSQQNVLVTITMGKINGGEKRSEESYQLIVVGGGETAEVMRGDRIPIPVTTFQVASPPREIVPMTSYTYQNVGFTAEVRAWVNGDGRITLAAEIEDSHLAASAAKNPQPKITTSQQRIRAVFEEGKPLQIVRYDQGSGSRYLEIEAEILD